MPTELFVDTSAWYPLANRSHPDHERLADALRRRIESGCRIVTTNLVVAESYVLILRRLHRRAALEFLNAVRQPPNLVVFSDPDLETEAERDWLARYSDQDFSLTDAVSFSVMAQRDIREALALDRHFLAAGFAATP